MNDRRLIIIPALNEARVIGRVITEVKAVNPGISVVVVDDGSVDGTANQAKLAGATVITHPINRGLGGAIGTGLAYARVEGYAAAVTFDADGQHDSKDITRVFKRLTQNEVQVVIGNRIHPGNHIPWDRKWLNFGANWLTFLLYGTKTADSQSGFRGFNRQAIEQIRIKTDRMEVSSEIFGEIARLKFKYAEVPIKVKYTQYSRYKGQQNTNALPVIIRLLLRLFR